MFKIVLFLFASCLAATEIDLSHHEKGLYSPNGEDGVIAALMRVVPIDRKVCVEFNVKGGVENSSTFLLRKQGWKGILFDRAEEIPSIGLYKEFINAGNVNKFFEKYNVPEEFELLAIHVGFNDFHIWNALDEKYKPMVVLIEYNGSIPADIDKVAKYRPFYLGDDTDYFGAGILSFARLAEAKGYTLVYAESSGTYLFFVRDDLIGDWEFANASDPEKLYRSAKNERRPDFKNREYLSSHELIKEIP